MWIVMQIAQVNGDDYPSVHSLHLSHEGALAECVKRNALNDGAVYEAEGPFSVEP